MELRSLRYFLAVAREGSITRAANALHLTQPTLSRQMQELEEELGARLLVRRSHSVELTPEGMRLRQRAGEVQALVEQTRAEFRQQGSAVEGDVYIGGGETRVMRHIAGIVRKVRDEHPGRKAAVPAASVPARNSRLVDWFMFMAGSFGSSWLRTAMIVS